jgi:hypothetical protein
VRRRNPFSYDDFTSACRPIWRNRLRG